jgi:hypothetical protein
LQFSLQAASPEIFGCTLAYWYGMMNGEQIRIWKEAVVVFSNHQKLKSNILQQWQKVKWKIFGNLLYTPSFSAPNFELFG